MHHHQRPDHGSEHRALVVSVPLAVEPAQHRERVTGELGVGLGPSALHVDPTTAESLISNPLGECLGAVLDVSCSAVLAFATWAELGRGGLTRPPGEGHEHIALGVAKQQRSTAEPCDQGLTP